MSFLRKGEVMAYVGRIHNLKDLKDTPPHGQGALLGHDPPSHGPCKLISHTVSLKVVLQKLILTQIHRHKSVDAFCILVIVKDKLT